MKRLEKKINKVKERRGLAKFYHLLFSRRSKNMTLEESEAWVTAQGPASPDLVKYVKENEAEYDVLVFITYLYYPTAFGITANPSKTILIPTAHDEWPIRLPVYKQVFLLPACIMYNTAAERKFANGLFHNEDVSSYIAGLAVEIPGDLPSVNVREKFNIDSEYILYVGRINWSKITRQDFDWFIKYCEESGKDIKLVLIGKAQIKIPSNNHILHLGYVDDVSKFNLLRHSLFLYQPSRLESLSLVLLEAFMMAKPVLVNSHCEVMKDHIDNSNGGFYYQDYVSFKIAMDQLVNNKALNIQMGVAGKLYTEKNYDWSSIVEKFRSVIQKIVSPL